MRVLAWALLAALPGVVSAEVGNPDHTIYGDVTLFDQSAPAGTPIELRSARDGSVLARYELGRDPRLGGRYALRVTMDDAGTRAAGRSRPGDPVRAFVGGRLAAETTVGAQGVAVELDLDPKNMGSVPTLDVADVALPEGLGGNTTMTFTVTLSAAGTQAASVDWSTREGTAIGGLACGPGVDFVRDQGKALVPAGATTASFGVIVCGDAAIELDETYFIDLSAVDNALAARSQVTATILDDDDEAAVTVADGAGVEPLSGNSALVFQATLSRPSAVNVSFAYATQDQDAVAGSDYAASSGIATIAAGELSTQIVVSLLADAQIESDEQFTLSLSDPVNANLTRTQAVGRIRDPRFKPEVAQEDVELGGEDGIADLLAPSAIALSSDGKHLYASSRTQNAILQFGRATDGSLAFVRSYTSQTAGFGAARLGGARDLRVSGDGKFVYVAAESDDALGVFARDQASGALSFVQSPHEGDADPNAAGGTVRGLDGPVALAFSPDGAQLYVAGGSGDSLAVYARDAITGRVSFVEAERDGIDDAGDAGPAVSWLDDPSGVALSPDGGQVYVCARSSGAVLRFDRNAADGKLVFAAALVDGTAGVDGIGGANALALSSDGAHLYAAGGGDNAIALFDRSADGALVWRKSFRKGDADLPGLGGVRALRIAPDGQQLFAAGFADDSFTVFARAQDGDLMPKQAVFDGQGPVQHLSGPVALEASADDKHVYVAAETDNAVLMFRRLGPMFGDGFESQ